MTRAPANRRPGFTLVELLVVLGLILALLGIALAVSQSSITDSHKTTNAADRVSGWLLIAKSKAMRDNAPRGLRFLVGPNGQIREAQFIEVPDSYTPLANVANIPPRLLMVRVNGQNTRVFVSNEANTTDLAQSVFVNDVLYLPESNTLHTLQTGVTQFQSTSLTIGGANVNAFEVFVRNPALLPQVPATAGPALVPTYATTAFGFHRQPQPAIGEPTLQLTGDVCVDGAVSLPTMTADYDVLFAPNGEVLNAPSGKVVLWVRDVTLPTPRPNGAAGPDDRARYEEAGQMALIVVYSKTGAIATQPVTLPTGANMAGHNPYSATTDAVNTGL